MCKKTSPINPMKQRIDIQSSPPPQEWNTWVTSIGRALLDIQLENAQLVPVCGPFQIVGSCGASPKLVLMIMDRIWLRLQITTLTPESQGNLLRKGRMGTVCKTVSCFCCNSCQISETEYLLSLILNLFQLQVR